MTRLAFLMWPDTFEDWYAPQGLDRAGYLDGYDGEWSIGVTSALVEAGVDVHVVYGTLGPPDIATQRPSGATTHFIRVAPAYRLLRQAVWGHRWWETTQRMWPLAPLASTLSPVLLGRLVSLRADAVVVQDYECVRYDVAAPLLRATGQRVVGLDTGGSARPSRAPWKPWTRRAASALLAVHEREAERLRLAGHPGARSWPVPVRTDRLRPGDRQVARRALGVPVSERVVFSAGRLHPVKNLTTLADACADLGATLVLAGEGAERGVLEGRAGVRLLGFQPPAALAEWYAACDVVALASLHEGQPVAVLEALACSRGVVATAVGGVPEVVRDGITGWLVPPRDAVALKAALADALADRAVADARGAAGRDYVLAHHAPGVVAARLLAIALG